MAKSKQQKKARRNRGRSSAAVDALMRGALANPPAYKPALTFTLRTRFQASAASGSGIGNRITGVDILNTALVAVTTTSVNFLASFARIKRVEMWAASTTGAGVSVGLRWGDSNLASIGAPGLEVEDMSLGTSNIAHISQSPPPNSLAAMWFGPAQINNVFSLFFPVNAVVDIVVEYNVANFESYGVSSPAVSGATVGMFGTRALDTSNGTTKLVPTDRVLFA